MDKGGELGNLPVPTREGYRFLSWTCGNENPVSAEKQIDANTELKATWIQVFTVTFKTSEGKLLHSQKVEYNGNAECEYSYCNSDSFIGWYEADSNTEFNLDTGITEDVTLYGKWEYTVTFNPNEGMLEEEEESTATVSAGSTVSLPVASREGYVFASWNTEAEGTGSPFYSDTIPSSNITVYAIWSKIHTVTFMSPKENEYSTQSVEDGKFVALSAPDNVNEATFVGWYTDNTFVTPFDSNIPVHDDINLYAKWTCEVTLNLDDAADQNEEPSYLKSIIVNKGERDTWNPSCSFKKGLQIPFLDHRKRRAGRRRGWKCSRSRSFCRYKDRDQY